MFVGIGSKLMVICLVMVLSIFLCEPVDAKKKRKRFISSVNVEEVTTFPDPFIIGQSPLTLSMMVKVPLSGVDRKVLEVSALITSPTRRTMSFVSQRLPLAEATQGGLLRLVPVDLVWDGKDQYDRLVADGSYFYEIQAKLMEDTGNGHRTKVVSRKIQGTLEALAYVGEVLPPLPPELEVPEEIEILQQEELVADTIPMVEEELKVADEAPVPGEELVSDEGDQVLEGSGKNESGQETMYENVEKLEPAVEAAEALLAETDSNALPSSGAGTVLPDVEETSSLATEQPLNQTPSEPSLSSVENSLLH